MYRRFFDLDPGPIAFTFGLQPASPERINSIEIPRSRSNSASDGIFSRDSTRRALLFLDRLEVVEQSVDPALDCGLALVAVFFASELEA